MQQAIAGSVAGFVATAPMTAVMLALHRRLPRREQYPLPPRRITMRVAEEAGVKQALDCDDRTAATYAGHFSYGTAAGAVYGLLAPHVPGSAVTKGVAFGLTVWAVSYLGWLPAAGMHPSAKDEPARRNELMIAAHIVWGAVTGVVASTLTGRRR